ncbi:hypothetical protein AT05_04695 [Schleiferia thermophila str. Yellowstone]|nr:hypothetical protein AT05_04695 [Schleiferia thermophila str. Yellowstone]
MQVTNFSNPGAKDRHVLQSQPFAHYRPSTIQSPSSGTFARKIKIPKTA